MQECQNLTEEATKGYKSGFERKEMNLKMCYDHLYLKRNKNSMDMVKDDNLVGTHQNGATPFV